MLSSSEQQQETIQVLKFIERHKKKLILFPLAAMALAVIITFFIPREYAAYGVVFPPDNPTLDHNVNNPNFGYDIEADRLLQILQSVEIRDSVVKQFGLIDYYEIDKTESDWRYKLMKQYKQDVDFERTAYMSIVITVQTKNPELSANIANYIIEMVNRVREKIYKQNLIIAYSKAQADFTLHKRIADSLLVNLKKDISLLNISGLVLLAPNAQLNFDFLSKAKAGGPENINIGVNILRYRHQFDRQNDYEGRLLRIKKVLDDPVPGIYVVDKAEPIYRKVSPSFTINALAAAFATLLLTVFVLVLKRQS